VTEQPIQYGQHKRMRRRPVEHDLEDRKRAWDRIRDPLSPGKAYGADVDLLEHGNRDSARRGVGDGSP
jgi:hypothetical protein